jgi:hypothetical protein
MPQYVGKFINKYIYEPLSEGVLEKIHELNPVTEKGYRAYQNHRFLTDTGNIHLDRQITSTITIMQLSNDKKEFEANFARIHTKLVAAEPKPLKLTAPKGPTVLPLFARLEKPEAAN